MANKKGITILDCATGSNLMKAGLPTGVCVEKWCLENPDVVISLQKATIEAGSDIIYTPTFGANRVKLGSYGLADKVKEYNTQLVNISKQAADGKAKIAGDVSSTGLFIKPFGDTDFSELYDIYFEQISALHDAGVDLIIAETLMNMSEARAALLAAKKVGLPAYVTITLEEGGHTLSGMSLLSAIITLQAMGAAAIGLNCSTGPEDMVDIIKEASRYSNVPIIAKPNACNPENPIDAQEFAKELLHCVDAGATIIGGCCGTTPEHISEVVKLLENHDIPTAEENEEVKCLANEKNVFFMTRNQQLSEPYRCDGFLADKLFEAEDQGVGIIVIELVSSSDIDELIDTLYMSQLPILFKTNYAELLDKALQVYQGRALIDSQSELTQDELIAAAGKYGAVIY